MVEPIEAVPEVKEPTLREMIISKTYPGAPSNVRIAVFPTKSFTQPGKFTLFSVDQNASFGKVRDTFQEAVEAANKENLRIGQPLLPTEPIIKRARKLLEPQQISDFRVGIDKVVREEGKTFVIDTEGVRKKIEVQSDIMAPEFEENIKKLNPEQKAKMIEQVRTTPYLSDEGRAERLAVLEAKPPAVEEVLAVPEVERAAKIKYYRQQEAKWRETAYKITEEPASKEGEQRFAYAMEKAEAFARQAGELEVKGDNPMPRIETERKAFHERIFGKGAIPPLERLGRGQTVNNLLPMSPEMGPPLPRMFALKWPWKGK